jgi:hypothetical protein
LIVAAAFPATRGFAASGMRIVLGGVLTVVFAAVAMGFTLSVLSTFLTKVPMTAGSFVGGNNGVAAWVQSPQYWAAFILGFVSVLFHLKAATLASNISGASDGPGAAAAVVAGGMSAFAAVKGFAVKKGGDVASNTTKAAGELRDGFNDRIWGKKPTT